MMIFSFINIYFLTLNTNYNYKQDYNSIDKTYEIHDRSLMFIICIYEIKSIIIIRITK